MSQKNEENQGRKKLGKRQFAMSGMENPVPVFIYLYYIKFLQGAQYPQTRAYFCFDYLNVGYNEDDLKNLITRFAINAHADGNSPPCYGTTLDDIYRRRKGYVVVVVDAADLGPGDATIEFEGQFDGSKNDAKHTLSVPKEMQVSVYEGGRVRTIVAFFSANGMKETDKSDLDPGEYEWFEFTLTSAKKPRGLPYEDSGGTNMGPPVGPPYLYVPWLRKSEAA